MAILAFVAIVAIVVALWRIRRPPPPPPVSEIDGHTILVFAPALLHDRHARLLQFAYANMKPEELRIIGNLRMLASGVAVVLTIATVGEAANVTKAITEAEGANVRPRTG